MDSDGPGGIVLTLLGVPEVFGPSGTFLRSALLGSLAPASHTCEAHRCCCPHCSGSSEAARGTWACPGWSSEMARAWAQTDLPTRVSEDQTLGLLMPHVNPSVLEGTLPNLNIKIAKP